MWRFRCTQSDPALPVPGCRKSQQVAAGRSGVSTSVFTTLLDEELAGLSASAAARARCVSCQKIQDKLLERDLIGVCNH